MAVNIRSRMRALMRRFASDRAATTAIEYALVAAIMGAAIIVGIATLGDSFVALIGRVAAAFTGEPS